jgi:cytidylate kinase
MNYHDLSLSVAQALLRSEVEARGHTAPDLIQFGQPFTITISREAGALGNTVANAIGRRLNWPVYDREILERIATEFQQQPRHLQEVDERPGSWLEECLSGLLAGYTVSSDKYLRYLIGTVRGLGKVGQCVIVGRGANFILPSYSTVRVRLVAALEDRVRVLAARSQFTEREAAAWVKSTERRRFEFVKGYFGKDPNDPHYYDLVLNTSRVGIDEAATTIIQLLEQFEQRNRKAEKERELAVR